MTGYERIRAALSGEMPDRRPIMLHGFMPAAREAGYTMRQYRDDPRIAAECHVRFAEKYDLDSILLDVDTALTAGACGVPVDFPDDEPARTHEPLLSSLDDDQLGRLETVNLGADRRIRHSLETVLLIKKTVGDQLYVRGNCDQAPFSLACSLRTPEAFMMDLMTTPERADRLLVLCTEICLQYLRLMAATGADMLSNGDSPAGPAMISPAMYARYALPYERALADEAKVLGKDYALHICGNTDLILEQMATLEVDMLDLDYLTPIERIYEVLHGRIALCGTIDPSGVMALGTPQQVRNKTRELLSLYRDEPRLIINAGCALPPTTPEANIRALVETAQEG